MAKDSRKVNNRRQERLFCLTNEKLLAYIPAFFSNRNGSCRGLEFYSLHKFMGCGASKLASMPEHNETEKLSTVSCKQVFVDRNVNAFFESKRRFPALSDIDEETNGNKCV